MESSFWAPLHEAPEIERLLVRLPERPYSPNAAVDSAARTARAGPFQTFEAAVAVMPANAVGLPVKLDGMNRNPAGTRDAMDVVVGLTAVVTATFEGRQPARSD